MSAQMPREVEEELTNLLSDLIRINTTNPPGNETEAAKYLTENLEKESFNCEPFEVVQGKGSVITARDGVCKKLLFSLFVNYFDSHAYVSVL